MVIRSPTTLIYAYLCVPCAASLFFSFSMFRCGANLGAVATLLPASCPTGQRGGGLAECPLPTQMICFGHPLRA